MEKFEFENPYNSLSPVRILQIFIREVIYVDPLGTRPLDEDNSEVEHLTLVFLLGSAHTDSPQWPRVVHPPSPLSIIYDLCLASILQLKVVLQRGGIMKRASLG